MRVYSRAGCHLCELLIEELLPMIRGRVELEIVDIDTDPSLESRFGTRIPVVEFAGRALCEHVLDGAAVRAALDELPAQ